MADAKKESAAPAVAIFHQRVSGGVHLVRLDEEILGRDPQLKRLVERVQELPSVGEYEKSYEKGGGHDKEHDRGGGHGNSFSRT